MLTAKKMGARRPTLLLERQATPRHCKKMMRNKKHITQIPNPMVVMNSTLHITMTLWTAYGR